MQKFWSQRRTCTILCASDLGLIDLGPRFGAFLIKELEDFYLDFYMDVLALVEKFTDFGASLLIVEIIFTQDGYGRQLCCFSESLCREV